MGDDPPLARADLPPVELAVDRGAREWAAIDAALAAGEIDEAGWFERTMAVLVPAYLAGDNPRAQSGQSGDEARWEAARRPVLAAVDAPGDFLDIGCASGYLMECVHAWAAQDGVVLEPYGLDLSPELADLARRRLPHWADRIWTGNALYWQPARRFDYVRTGLDYVPAPRRLDYVAHLLAHVVGRRLIVGVYNEVREPAETEDLVTAGGYRIAGRLEWPKPGDDRVMRRVFWIDAP
jgi:SAM-dependent methyltransferase